MMATLLGLGKGIMDNSLIFKEFMSGREIDFLIIEINMVSIRFLGMQSFFLKEIACAQGRRQQKSASFPSRRGELLL